MGRRARLSDASLAWDVRGSGPPVVLVHGTPTWSFLWRGVAPTLAERFTVYELDLLGYGGSPAPRHADLSLSGHARRLAELLDEWGLERPAIVGHDIGGGIALHAHLVGGRPFRRIVLVDAVILASWMTPATRHIQTHLEAYRTMPGHIFERVIAAHLRTAVAREPDEETLAAYLRPWEGEDGQVAYLEKIRQFDEDEARELEPRLASIAVPVLVLWGERDAWLDVSLADRLARTVPTAEARIVPGAGHFAMEDAPHEVAGELLDFLSER